MFGFKRVSSRFGWKVQSRKGWFFLGLGSEIYTLHLSLGKLSVAFEQSPKKRMKMALDKSTQGA